MEEFSVSQLYDFAMQVAGEIVQRRVWTVAVLIAFVFFILTLLISSWLDNGRKKNYILAFVIAMVAFFVVKGNVSQKMTDIGHELANAAITQGVDQARKAQATEFQYLHAAVSSYGADKQFCQRTVNYRDFCSSNTSYYSTRQINPHDCNCHDDCDSDGKNCHRDCDTCYDDEYTPWFTYVTRYWIVADTKMKYLHSGIYEMAVGDPNSKPQIYLHRDWRAPDDAAANTFQNRGLPWGDFNNKIPEFWDRVRKNAQEGGPVVVANFVGPYFHWGLASESTQFSVYGGQYKTLQTLAKLPVPSGVTFNYKDAFGQPAKMVTQLSAKDTDLALDFQGITVIGVSLRPELLDSLNKKAVEFQGIAGPSKEASVRWFIVSDQVVNQLGGLRDTTTAIKAYLNDFQVFGHFRLAKNLLIIVQSVSNDGTMITGRDLETGMPFGNVLVAQRMRLSIEPGKPLPLTPENFFGTFSDSYEPTKSGSLAYHYTEMPLAGSVIGLLYESTPGYKAPDPNSDECNTAPAEHLGFIRYSMCTQQYRESDVAINKDGALLILDGVKSGAKKQTPVWFSWTLFGLAVCAGVYMLASKNS